jgi:hypothetical protein
MPSLVLQAIATSRAAGLVCWLAGKWRSWAGIAAGLAWGDRFGVSGAVGEIRGPSCGLHLGSSTPCHPRTSTGPHSARIPPCPQPSPPPMGGCRVHRQARHRRPISGSIKDRVLTRARARCECYGAGCCCSANPAPEGPGVGPHRAQKPRQFRRPQATCRRSASAALPASAMQFASVRGHHRLPRSAGQRRPARDRSEWQGCRHIGETD